MTFWKKTARGAVTQALRHQQRNSSYNASPSTSSIGKHFEEISIEVPWGKLAGKWYGPKHVRPIVGLHGWQDNAGTFDTLAPLLPQHLSFLSIDLPGHGLSSWLPDGMCYHSIDYVSLLRRIMEQYKWDKISMLAHSMSSMNGFVFSALFPDKVDLFIGLDALKPIQRSHSKLIEIYADRIDAAMKIERRMRSHAEPPSYEWEQLVERMYNGMEKSVNLESCKYLLQRNTKMSQLDANKYYFSRDSRLKSSLFYSFSHEFCLEMAERIKVPHLFVKAINGPYYENKKYFNEVLDVLKMNPNFEFHEAEGTHHVHLNEPEKIAKIVNPFLCKYRP